MLSMKILSTRVASARSARSRRLPPVMGASADMESMKQNPPRFPAEARRAGSSGVVVLVISIGSNGLTTLITIEVSSGDDVLDMAAAEAAKHWRFHPAMAGSVALASRVRVPVNFRPPPKVILLTH